MPALPPCCDPVIDLRDLPAPEPLRRALRAADALLPGAAVCVLTPVVPLPLLDALVQRGLHYRVRGLADGGAQVHIERREDDAARA